MKAKVITAILILTLFTTTFAQDANTQEKIPYRHKEMMKVPLYEKNISDYRVSKSLKYGLNWMTIGAVPYPLLRMYNDSFTDGLALISAIIFCPSTGVLGGAYGYWRGIGMNKKKVGDPDFYTEMPVIGHEFSYVKSFRSKDSKYDQDDTPKYSLVYQVFSKDEFVPSEYRLGFTVREFRENVFEDYMSDINAIEKRLSFDVLFNSNKDKFQLHYGLGAGYSWGEATTEIDYENSETEKMDGFFIYPIAGITVNANDFFYIRFEGYYELSEFRLKVSDLYGRKEQGCPGMSFSFGTYLF
jgi:hypothetical protein